MKCGIKMIRALNADGVQFIVVLIMGWIQRKVASEKL
jgi:hypothetical protein